MQRRTMEKNEEKDLSCSGGIKTHSEETRNDDQLAQNSYTDGEKYQVVDIPGKGRGLVAKQSLKRGELILKDKPLFLVPSSVHSHDPRKLDEYLAAEVKNLRDEDRSAFWSLADSKSATKKTERGIYFTNCYSIGSFTSTRCSTALLPILSYANHSCRPNTEFHWNDAYEYEELRASRDIAKGEELTDCYLDFTVKGRITRDERRRVLSLGYGFHCCCEACSLDEQSLLEEDKLREEALVLASSGFQADESLSFAEMKSLLSAAERWLQLRIKLGYKIIHQLEPAEVTWHLAMLTGDQAKADHVAKLGIDLACTRYGPGSKEENMWAERLENPIRSILG